MLKIRILASSSSLSAVLTPVMDSSSMLVGRTKFKVLSLMVGYALELKMFAAGLTTVSIVRCNLTDAEARLLRVWM